MKTLISKDLWGRKTLKTIHASFGFLRTYLLLKKTYSVKGGQISSGTGLKKK